MAFKRIVVACLTAAVCLSSPLIVFAEENQQVTETYENSFENPDDPNDVNLIANYSLYCYKSSNTIYITSSTVGNKTLAEIGITNIQVQRSTNGTSCVCRRQNRTDTDLEPHAAGLSTAPCRSRTALYRSLTALRTN